MGQQITLAHIQNHQYQPSPQQVEAFKNLLRDHVRAQWKKDKINRINVTNIALLPKHWSNIRIVFEPNGRVDYIAGQDYDWEIRQVVDGYLGKKP